MDTNTKSEPSKKSPVKKRIDNLPITGPDAFFTSWSGGKDSCLAFYRARQRGLKPQALLTMMAENGERSRSHGLSIDLLSAQARSMGIPLTVKSASWESYEQVFTSALCDMWNRGIVNGVFGDIDLKQHREWVEKVAKQAGIRPIFPLWQEERAQTRTRVKIIKDFLDCGFQAMIIAVKDGILASDFLSRIFDDKLVNELEKMGVDPAGEEGEFHTVVIDGPIFNYPLNPKPKERMLIDGYWFLDLSPR